LVVQLLLLHTALLPFKWCMNMQELLLVLQLLLQDCMLLLLCCAAVCPIL
jgi:hypothetical protein